MDTNEKLYFAYGSNMGPSAFRSRCPLARQVGTAKVARYRVGFTRFSNRRGGGVADLVEAVGSVVWGAIYDLSYDGFDALDKAEGVAIGAYARTIWKLTRGDGSHLSAWTYVVVEKQPEILPRQDYWKLLVDGGTEAGLPPDYVKTLEAIPYAI